MGALVLVHGLAHGAWCWGRTEADLVGRGHDVFAVDLPLTGLDDGAAAVRQALDDWGRDAVLVGHSYAGLVISRAAAERHDVQHLVYVAAMRTGAEPWKSIPSTYVLCVRDRAIHPDFQRWMSTRAGDVITIDTDHSPFMSSPEQFVDLLHGIADKANASARITRSTC